MSEAHPQLRGQKQAVGCGLWTPGREAEAEKGCGVGRGVGHYAPHQTGAKTPAGSPTGSVRAFSRNEEEPGRRHLESEIPSFYMLTVVLPNLACSNPSTKW